jgi:hypothetical protein
MITDNQPEPKKKRQKLKDKVWIPEILTEDEQKLINDISKVWNSFISLPVLHSADKPDFCNGIHVLQRIVLSRPAIRTAQKQIQAKKQPEPKPESKSTK